MKKLYPERLKITNDLRALTTPFILLLAALLRFYRLSGQSLWADEGNSVALAHRSFMEIARRTAFDIHPPLYYWLLKIWISLFGDSEIGLRSLSVVLGVAVVYLIGVLGTRLFSPRLGLIAAFIAAFSPFQIYYSQEARMYMLLTLVGSLTVLVMLIILKRYSTGEKSTIAGLIYMVTVTAGLYTHYAYPLIWLVVNLVALGWLVRMVFNYRQSSADGQTSTANTYLQPKRSFLQRSAILNWLLLQLVPLLFYLPWLPTAWRQLTTWPSEREAGSLLQILGTISTTLLFGLSWPYNLELATAGGLGLVLLVTIGLALNKESRPDAGSSRRQYGTPGNFSAGPIPFSIPAFILLGLWFLLPVLLTALIFTPAFLKFLLVATPPLTLLLALVVAWLTGRWHFPAGDAVRPAPYAGRPSSGAAVRYLAGSLLLFLLVAGSVLSLYHYYTDPAYARDDYRAIANFIKAVGGPEDAVILHAEGQQEVFNYYYEQRGPNSKAEAPVFPLPRQRPLDEVATLKELEQIAGQADTVYGVYWATRQADPDGLIEGWLNNHLFKATDQWYGNVRLVSYGNPQALADSTIIPADYRLGQHIRLTGYRLSTSQVVPGEILEVALTWETEEPIAENYTVFVQVVDQANHLVGQRDASPSIPSPNWSVATPVIDGHGIFIEPGTPPGPHRLIVGLYDSQTGLRLPVTSGDRTAEESVKEFIELGGVEVARPDMPLPRGAYNIQTALNAPMLEVTLLGYDLYKLGHRSTPDTPLYPGDPLHLVAYWTPTRPVQGLEDQLLIQIVPTKGRESPLLVTHQPAGTPYYPIEAWQPGEIVRAQYDLFLKDIGPGTYRLALTLQVKGSSMEQVTALTKPFWVE